MNDAVTASANFPTSGSGQTASAAAATATVAYDLASRGYTITVAGRSQTFLPSEIDAAQSNATVTVYVKTNGSTTDTLTLTKPGTSGRFTFEYVGGGYWQRTVQGSSAVSGNLEAFAYGFATPDAATPRTGQAVYAVDLLGAITVPNNVVGVTGQGQLIADLANGRIIIRGSIPGSGPVPFTDFSGTATLSSSANGFGGTIRFSGSGSPTLNGSVNGRFYGPAAQEVGAAFGASDGSANAIAGTLIGRRQTVAGGNTDIKATTADEFFQGDAARLSFDGNQGTPVTVRSNSVSGVSVYHDQSDGTYDLLLSDRTALIRNRDFIATSLNNNFYAGVSNTETYADINAGGHQYLRAGRSYTMNGPRHVFDDVVFGIATPDSAFPRTGDGGFVIRLAGSIAETGANEIRTFRGQGSLIANFATGAITTEGSLENFFGASTPAIGAFSGTATIASGANAFSGTINFTGVGTYSGALRGRFFGPTVNEVGGVFSLSGTNGSVASGVLTGTNDPAVANAGKGLLDLTQSTGLASTTSVYTNTPSVSPSESAGTFGPLTVTFDPVAKSYRIANNFTGNVPGVASLFPLDVTDASRVVAESTALFDVYRANGVTTRIYKPGSTNTELALTYASFADITASGASVGGQTTDARYLLPFGIQTPSSQMPRTGSGTYNGIAYGYGRVDQVNSREASVTGTSRFDVNFGAGTLDMTLSLNARNSASGATASLGSFLFNGTLGGNMPGGGVGSPSFTGRQGDNSFQGVMNGLFFGANAAEIGAAFTIDKQDLLTPGSPRVLINGVALGKKP